MPQNQQTLHADDVAYWYLRLNGFLTIQNFLVHGDRGGDARTDIDVLGVRFKFRHEHLANPIRDDAWLAEADANVVVFCEATKEPKDFNNAWSRRDRKVMESFLALVGILPEEQHATIAADLYDRGVSRSAKGYLITTLLIHHDPGNVAHSRWQGAKIIQLEDALAFIHERFDAYSRIKSDHAQWCPSGHHLWDCFQDHRNDFDGFVRTILNRIGAQGPTQER